MNLKAGVKMFVAGKNNIYKLVDKSQNEDGSQKWFRVECVDFYGRDDLGDGIMCHEVGEKIWISNFHFHHMPVLDNFNLE